MTDTVTSINPASPAMKLLGQMISIYHRSWETEAMDIEQVFMKVFHDELCEALQFSDRTWGVYCPIMLELIELQQKPGGWRDIDAAWEHMAGVPLVEVMKVFPVEIFLNPADDFSLGWEYKLSSTLTHDGDEDGEFYLQTLVPSFFANDFNVAVAAFPTYANTCDEYLRHVLKAEAFRYRGERNNLPEIDLYLCRKPRHERDDDTILMYTTLGVEHKDQVGSSRLNPAKFSFSKDRARCLEAIEQAFGPQALEMTAASLLENDLWL